MKIGFKIYVTFIAMLLIGGCTPSSMILPPKSNNESLILGYINMQESGRAFTGALFKQVNPPIEHPYIGSNIHQFQYFFTQRGVQPGNYKMDELRTLGGFQNRVVTVYEFPKSEKGDLDVKVTKPGIYFVGSWKFKKLSRDKFDLEKLSSPTELEVLNEVLEYAEDAYWKGLITQRINQLNKSK